MKKAFVLLAILLFVFIIGCGRGVEYYVKIDSINAPGVSVKNKYILLPGVKNVESSDLQFREYASYIDKALAARGFIKADDFKNANVLIFIVYGIGDPEEHQYTYSLPVYGQTGISSSTTSGTLRTQGDYGTYQSTTTYTPQYGITGYTTHRGSRITYFRFLVLDAVDLDEYKGTQKVMPLWKTTATSTGSSGDLREVFPVLVAASVPYIGTNTGKKINISIRENDKQVIEIKGTGAIKK